MWLRRGQCQRPGILQNIRRGISNLDFMTRTSKFPRPIGRHPAYRQAFERLDEGLEENTPSDYSEKTELLGRFMFGDLWREREQPGTVVLPK